MIFFFFFISNFFHKIYFNHDLPSLNSSLAYQTSYSLSLNKYQNKQTKNRQKVTKWNKCFSHKINKKKQDKHH